MRGCQGLFSEPPPLPNGLRHSHIEGRRRAPPFPPLAKRVAGRADSGEARAGWGALPPGASSTIRRGCRWLPWKKLSRYEKTGALAVAESLLSAALASCATRAASTLIKCQKMAAARPRRLAAEPAQPAVLRRAPSPLPLSRWAYGIHTLKVGGAHLPLPPLAKRVAGRVGRSPSGVGVLPRGASLTIGRGCRWLPWPNRRVVLVALSPRPATPHPYPSPPLGFAERGEGGARSRDV